MYEEQNGFMLKEFPRILFFYTCTYLEINRLTNNNDLSRYFTVRPISKGIMVSTYQCSGVFIETRTHAHRLVVDHFSGKLDLPPEHLILKVIRIASYLKISN